MRKKTNKALFAALGILGLLFAALGVFSLFKRRTDFLKQGDTVMAEFCITFGLALLGIALLSAVLIMLLLKRDKKTEFMQNSFYPELKKCPAFETWFLQETKLIQKQYKTPRRIGVVYSVLLAIMLVFMIFLILNDIGGVLIYCSIVAAAAGIVLLLQLSDYNRNFINPMLKSVDSELSGPSAKEDFANQIMGKGIGKFVYARGSQAFSSTAFIMPDYCYFRQFRSSCIIVNANMRKAVLKPVSYTVGLRPHFRSCYAMELYLDSDSLNQPVWYGCFTKREAMYQALALMQSAGVARVEIDDRLK